MSTFYKKVQNHTKYILQVDIKFFVWYNQIDYKEGKCSSMNDILTVQVDYRKAQIPVDDIAYVTVEGRKTKITRSDGSALRTNRSLKDVYALLPQDVFSNINRGIVISKRYVQDEKNGVLTMTDGTQFRRRVRSDRAPKPQNKKAPHPDQNHVPCPTATLESWLNNMPMPMLVMELVYKTGGMDFVVRFCNREMARLEAVSPQEILNQSISAFPQMGSPKWMAIFADVALHGSTRSIEDAMEGSGQYMLLRCYQPQPGYCACILTDLTRENNLIRELFRQEPG